tara:strand:- start:10515 stop:10865 length:351 start_codon:yes stop_codon:yes gene_type:complete
MAEKKAPTENQEGSTAVDELVGMIQKAGPEAQKAMREALGVGGAIKKPPPTQSNQDAKRIAYSVGEIVQPEGFQPKASQAKAEEGPEAVAEWLAQWNQRNSNPSSQAEEYADIAQM